MDEIENFIYNKMWHRVAQNRREWCRRQKAFAQNRGLQSKRFDVLSNNKWYKKKKQKNNVLFYQ